MIDNIYEVIITINAWSNLTFNGLNCSMKWGGNDLS